MVFAVLVVIIASWMLIPAVLAHPHVTTVDGLSQSSPRTSSSSAANAGPSARESAQGIVGGTALSLIVHIVGEVNHPGLISVPIGSRVIDAVLKAGGLTVTANQCAINLARELRDGEQIIIPRHTDGSDDCVAHASSGEGSSGSASGLVSLSSASAAELDTLPGVGPALAQRIIDYREAHGAFSSVNELDNVSGIGPSLLSSLGPLVTP